MFVNRDNSGVWQISWSQSDLSRWKSLTRGFKHRAQLTPRGWWRHASSEELWKKLVGEFAVRGGVRLFENLERDVAKYELYRRLISLRALTISRSPVSQLRLAMRLATRFWRTAASSLGKCLRDKSVIKCSKFVLLENLPNGLSDLETRDLILERCPQPKLKGTSDFLIGVGAAQDLAAIDTRIIRCLEKHFSAGPCIKYVRTSRDCYIALESALRQVAQANRIPLSTLDRTIFQASGMSALDFIVRK